MLKTGNPELTIHEMFQRVRSESTPGLFASEGPLYFGAVFGRDSLEASEHMLGFEPYIPRYNTLLVLASLQGLEDNPSSEEEPGRIHHEYRKLADAPDENSKRIFDEQNEVFGGTGKEVTRFDTIDATPLFVRLSVDYIKMYGYEILDDVVKGRDGQLRPFSEHLRMASDWVQSQIAESDIGLMEFKRKNPQAIINQVWEDSDTSYLHIDGSSPNYDYPIAPAEVQGYAYDALKRMDEMFPGTVKKGLVQEYGQKIIDNYWLPDQQMFAKGIDRDTQGQPRPILTPDSNGALLLDSDLLLDFPGTEKMVQATIDMVMGSDFLTPAGIRCRSLAYQDLVEYPDYHGSYAVWAKHTANIMKGMLRHGRDKVAQYLAQTIVDNVALHEKEFFELNFVDADNKVIHPNHQNGIFADKRVNIPEPGQTWTKSAFLFALNVLSEQAQAA